MGIYRRRYADITVRFPEPIPACTDEQFERFVAPIADIWMETPLGNQVLMADIGKRSVTFSASCWKTSDTKARIHVARMAARTLRLKGERGV